MTSAVRFTIPGPPVGYYAQGRWPNRQREQKYIQFKRAVQRGAMAAGIRLPLTATAEEQLFIQVWPFFASGVHADPGNVQKGVVDALFWTPVVARRGSADKHTGGLFPPPLYDRQNPRTEIVIEKMADVDRWVERVRHAKSLDAQGEGAGVAGRDLRTQPMPAGDSSPRALAAAMAGSGDRLGDNQLGEGNRQGDS